MAEDSIPTPGLPADTASEALAPTSLAGWAQWQRAVNVDLPAAIAQAQARLREATKLLGS